MTPTGRLSAVLELLEDIEALSRPADALTSAFFRARRYIGSKDRNAISSMLYDTLRHKARLIWWIEKLGAPDTQRCHFLIYLRLVQKMQQAEVEISFNGSRYAPDVLDIDERKLLGHLAGRTLFHPDMPQHTQLECPIWAYDSLKKKFGKKVKIELEALLQAAPLDIRVNTLKISREEALKELLENGIKVEKTPYSPLGLRAYERPSLGNIALLKEGALEIQDEGSQLVALLLDPKSGERVVDFCAGAGGKTLAISALMENKGRITACDVMAKRLEQSLKRFRRAGLHNIEIKPLTSERDPWVKRHKEMFDRVLVDAPCSGTGTWRRSPNARWHNLGPDLKALVLLQKSILESAARLVKKGGRLVYATCSMLPEENEAQIQQFLDNHPDFTLIPIQEYSTSPSPCGRVEIAKQFRGGVDPLPQTQTSTTEQKSPNFPNTGNFLSLTPALHGTDGFFAAIIERAD